MLNGRVVVLLFAVTIPSKQKRVLIFRYNLMRLESGKGGAEIGKIFI